MINNFLTSLLGLNLYVYGLGVFISLVVFLFIFWRNLRKTSLSEERMVDALFGAGVLSLIVGRVAYVVINYKLFESNLLTPFLLVNYPGVAEFYFLLSFFVYWFFYGIKKKIDFNSLIKLFFAPIVVIKALLAAFSLIKVFNLASFVLLICLLILIGLYLALTQWLKKKSLKERPFSLLIFYLIVPNFLVDFFQEGRVYFLESKFLSIEQLPYLVVMVISTVLLIFSLIKKKK